MPSMLDQGGPFRAGCEEDRAGHGMPRCWHDVSVMQRLAGFVQSSTCRPTPTIAGA